MSIIGNVRERLIADRRADVLCRCLSDVLPQDAHVLDVGCGDGFLATKIMNRRPDVQIKGIDVLIRPVNHIPVQEFNGEHIPLADDSVDVVMFVDVLHHTDDPLILPREACRVARKSVVIKDHTRNGLFANSTLRFMDWVGNAHHGVALPYNYWSRSQWYEASEQLGLEIDAWNDALRLYRLPADWLFGRQLHFVTRLNLSLNSNVATIDSQATENVE